MTKMDNRIIGRSYELVLRTWCNVFQKSSPMEEISSESVIVSTEWTVPLFVG